MELQPASRFEWERIVRRCILPGPVKLLAYTLAQYGNPAGRDIRPGTPRLSAVCGMGGRTVERHLSTLRDLGLVERLANGGGPHRMAALYRLTVPDDLLDRIPMLDPDEVTPARYVAGVDAPAGLSTDATQMAGDTCGQPVDNQRTSATVVAGVEAAPDGELPPSQTELPPFGATTPATQVADHQTTTQLTPPSRSLESLRHLCDQQVTADPDPPPDPDAELRRQLAALATWTTDHPETRETA
jgi:DNA-binding transcriptional ArsR family regulator